MPVNSCQQIFTKNAKNIALDLASKIYNLILGKVQREYEQYSVALALVHFWKVAKAIVLDLRSKIYQLILVIFSHKMQGV